MQAVQFQFSIGQDVIIERSGIKGRVVGLFVDEDDTHHAYVEYSGTEGKITNQYFRNDRLRALDSPGK